jgi:hypothetical protein
MKRLSHVMLTLVAAAVVVSLSGRAAAGVPSQADASGVCSCLADFDRLVQQIEVNYVGHALYVTDENRGGYEALKQSLRAQAVEAPGAECVFVLRELTGWFGDGHLFVVEHPVVSADSAVTLAAAAEQDDRSESDLRRYLVDNRTELDPIEGVWYSKRGHRVAVVRDRASPDRGFVGVLLTDTLANWRAGQVKAKFQLRGDGEYAATVYGDDHAPRHYDAALYRDLLLHMPPLTWGQEAPLRPEQVGALDPLDPRAPVLRVLASGDIHLSVPSHDPAYRDHLDSLLAAHDATIRAAGTLIVDLRGNEGGSSLTTRGLEPYLRSEDRLPRLGPQGPRAVLVSEDNLDYFVRLGESEEEIAALRPMMGKVVEVPSSPRVNVAADSLPVLPRPAHVAVLVDRGVVSAAEAFLLSALESTKVTVFGENTGGVIDLQNVRLVRLACERRGLLLGYPTIAASAALPEGGLNATGIAPHVRFERDERQPLVRILQHDEEERSRQ